MVSRVYDLCRLDCVVKFEMTEKGAVPTQRPHIIKKCSGSFDHSSKCCFVSDVPTYLPGDISVPSILENTPLQGDSTFSTMIENKRSYMKKEIKTEPRSEPLYTVTSNRLFSILEVNSS